MMRIAIWTAAVLFTTALTIPMSAQTPNVTYLDHEKVAAAIAKGRLLANAPTPTRSKNFKAGIATRGKVLGSGYVKRAFKNADEFFSH